MDDWGFMRILGCTLCVGAALGVAAAAPPVSESRANDVLERYLDSAGTRPSATGPVSFEIDASLPKLRKRGTMDGLKIFASAGRVVYTQLHFVGDELVKTAVIARFLKADSSQSSSGADIAVSRLHYAFHFVGTADYNGRTAVVFRTEPKKKRVGLFRGQLWLDMETARPLREWGQFVKSPSPMLSGISFVRDYQVSDSDSRPRRIIVRMKAIWVGPVEMTVWFQDPVVASRSLIPPARNILAATMHASEASPAAETTRP